VLAVILVMIAMFSRVLRSREDRTAFARPFFRH